MTAISEICEITNDPVLNSFNLFKRYPSFCQLMGRPNDLDNSRHVDNLYNLHGKHPTKLLAFDDH